ncbi:hypothetical protein FE257_008035 [Aspergillus nanangensis]|uniref:GPI anchored protein n=1 Tax=Aspergillus nanangensis TaxID=2582783 RepID=A0AAD4CMP3_ASPNN|nr:hypothetical protein FE257_008035 [Aspergillus nanangensis]
MHLNAIWIAIPAMATAYEVVTILMPEDDFTGVGRVLGSSGGLTTYAISCDPSITWGDCAAPFTVAVGESIWQMTYTQPDSFVSYECNVVEKSSMNCMMVQSFYGSSVVTYYTDQDVGKGMPVTITGTDIATSSSGSAAKTADGTAATSNPTVAENSGAKQTGASSSLSSAGDASSTASSPSSSTSENAAMVHSSAHWTAVGGVAMALAVAVAVVV